MSDDIKRVVRRDFDQLAAPGQLPPVDWTLYDVPAMMRACAGEGEQRALDQVKAWQKLSEAKMAEYDNFSRIRDKIAAAWPPEKSPAAAEYLKRLDEMLFSISNVAATAAGNAQRIETIVKTLAEAREKLEPLQRKWNATTSVWEAEHWDDTAGRLNDQAQQVMREAEKVVAEEATGIANPVWYKPRIWRDGEDATLLPESGNSPNGGVIWAGSLSASGGSGSGVPRSASPSADRSTGGGLSPITGGPSPIAGSQWQSGDGGPWPGWQPVPGPDLSGVATGGGASMLPIPPGNPYAPHGGTYTLPSPGNPQGFITHAGGPAAGGIAAGSGVGAAGMAMMPAPMGAPAGRGSQGGGSPYRGRANTVWEIARGVAPVIEGSPWTGTGQQPGSGLEDLFRDERWLDDPDLAARISFRNTEETR